MPIEMGTSEPFCHGWPGTTILPLSAFWIAGMTGAHHHSQVLVENRFKKLFAQACLKQQSSWSQQLELKAGATYIWINYIFELKFCEDVQILNANKMFNFLSIIWVVQKLGPHKYPWIQTDKNWENRHVR
jgi:hypothetical protein